jgi:hypothetical protein
MEKFEILFYSTPEENANIEVFYEFETFWLSQKKMAELFNVEVNTINYHLKEIFKTEELQENSVIRKFRITASDGKNYNTNFYNLDAIIAVGYRVNSAEAKRFEIWANNVGSFHHDVAKRLAEKQYDQFRIDQDKRFESDFDQLAKKLANSKPKKDGK